MKYSVKKAGFAIFSILVLCALGAVYFLYNSGIDAKKGGEAAIKKVAEPKERIEKYIVEPGDTIDKIFEKFAMPRELFFAVLKASESAHSLASIKAGNEARFLFSKDSGDFLGLEYDIDKDDYVEIVGEGEPKIFAAEIKDIIYETKIERKEGIIENSLFETALAEDIEPNIIMEMATIFSWDVDFASSVQKGDSFAVVYEKRYRDGEYVSGGKVLTASFTNNGKEFNAFFYEDPGGGADYYNEDGRRLRRQFLKSPLDYKRITSGFSYSRFHPILNTFTTHRAIDYAASAGTPISVTADGTVTYVGWKGGNGNYIRVRHGGGYETGYAHLSAYAKGIKAGVKVQQNQVIGFVGSTGLSTGPHLHYEMLKNGVFINPLTLDLPPGEKLADEYMEGFMAEKMSFENLLKIEGGL